ncbi:hypothetical protein C0966_12825 [Bacillus methanolicus]|uniref:SGNH/GDSL hydrolase family protein n=1 Tax=Bacillus methanolicus TaxID=1471 RepID=UPI002380235A|nr:SGNH/GDSL hydrolase family protein [Bacillus methanolicus]MDE3840225.1 hypothetical protein [Bacillus methanolicus]
MRVFLTTILAIACAIVLILGNLHWDKKTAISSKNGNNIETTKIDSKSLNDSSSSVEGKEALNEDLIKLAKNWPKEGLEVYKKALKEGRPYKILIVGSASLAADSGGWPNLVKKKLMDAYSGTISVTFKEYNLNSLEFVQQDKTQELIDEKADMILFEPFILNDNGIVRIEDTLDNIMNIMKEVKTNNPDTTFVLQPPHPLFNAKYYPLQVEELKKFTKQNNIPYLDHWAAWPDPATEEIKKYLLEDQSGPNQEGHKIWGKVVEDYLINQ